jgi:hypothetical protein
LGFFGAGQRRGVHVNAPEIGSRDGDLCIGGIWGSHADLRREFNWRNLVLVIFEVLTGVPRGYIEEGDQWCMFEGMFCAIGGGFVRSN